MARIEQRLSALEAQHTPMANALLKALAERAVLTDIEAAGLTTGALVIHILKRKHHESSSKT